MTSLLLAHTLFLAKSDGPRPTILAAAIRPARIAPGSMTTIEYRWRAVRLPAEYSVFVHIVGPKGETVTQDDHQPPDPTTEWRGSVTYIRKFRVPKTWTDGRYRIEAGLYRARPASAGGGWENLTLETGPGVTGDADGHYTVGTLVVDRKAPPTPLASSGPATLNLKGYRVTFDESFDRPLSVSAQGPAGPGGTTWIAHKPGGGDFGDAPFADPGADFPFTVKDGHLRITARKDAGGWKAGLLASCDPQGRGFSQTYGYFEMRAKFPKGPGTWPAFWMLQRDHLVRPETPDVEIDVVEQYGVSPDTLHTTLHTWKPEPEGHRAWGDQFAVEDMSLGFHRYGLLWDAKAIVWYLDGVELWRRPTPPEAHSPMYLLVNLALGGGWPIEGTPNPSTMEVDYIRVYGREPSRKR